MTARQREGAPDTRRVSMATLRQTLDSYRVEFWLVVAGLLLCGAFASVERVMLTETGQPSVNGVAPTEVSYVHGLGVPLDDAYIHARFAENLKEGFGYSFNPPSVITADTSPLWVLLIALFGRFVTHLELVAIGLSVLSYLIIGPGVYRTARDVFGLPERYALLSGVLAVASSRLLWGAMSGMETTLAALLTLLVVEEHERQRQRGVMRVREGMWLGFGLLVRPEFLFLAVVMIADWAWIIRGKRANGERALLALFVLVAIAAPGFLLPLVTSGSLLSHSSVVQGARFSVVPEIGYLWFVFRVFVSNSGIAWLGLLLALPLLAKERRYSMALVVVLGIPVVNAFVAPVYRHHGRYLFIVLPVLVLCGVAGLHALIERFGNRRRYVFVFVACAAVGLSLIETGRWSVLEAESVRNINDQHLAIARWLPTVLRPTDRIAAHDIGAIGYYSGRSVIDLTGLATPALWPIQHDQDSVWAAARGMGANFFVIYNRLNPSLYERHKDSLTLLREFRIRKPLISAADTVMSVYRVKEVTRGS